MGKKLINLQPWLDYFDMLRVYEKNGFLEIQTDKHEAYVTLPALHAMSDGDNPVEQIKKAIPDTVRRIRTYAAFKSQDEEYLTKPFALHVVTSDKPYERLYTLLLAVCNRWLWKYETIKVLTYD